MSDACPLIELSGKPYDRGVQYGRQAATRIRRGAALYAAQIEKAGLDWDATRALVAEYLPVIEQFEPRYVVEMRGIAVGAAVSFEHVALLNARTEILRLAQRPDLRARLAEAAPDGCTGVVVMPEATQDGRLIHAQTWDWLAECADTAVVLRIRNDTAPDILTFTEAGGLARSGLNDAGIAITANYLESDRDYRQVGVPLALIRRRVLEQEHVALAMRAVHATAKSASNNMMVSYTTPSDQAVAVDFECAPDESFQLYPEGGLLVHANHFVSPAALARLRDTGIAGTPCSLYRDARVRNLLAPRRGAITVDDVKAALFDDFASPFSVCRPTRPNAGDDMTATVAMIVMQPAAGTLEICMLPALNREFHRFAFGGETAQAAAE